MKAILCGNLRTIENGTIKDGVILIKDGKILDAGKISVPEGCEVIDASLYEVMPGFVDAHTHIGIMGEGVGDVENDGNEMTDPITPHIRALDGIDPFDNSVKETMQAGITTVMIAPGSANCIGGICSVFKTRGKTVEEMLLVKNAGTKFALGENPKRVYGSQKKSPFTRMGIAALIRENLYKACEYIQKKNSNKNKDLKFEKKYKMEALKDIIEGKKRARFHCHKAYDISTAIRIADEFNLDITLEHCTEGIKIADEIIKRNIPIVLSPLMNARSKYETRERDFENAAQLVKKGGAVSISTDGISQQARWLPLNAGLCIRYGMKEEEAFKAVTINPAKALCVDDKVGSITKGKDADIIIMDGHPLETRTKTLMVIIDGKIEYRQII